MKCENYQKNNILLDDDFMNFNISIFQTKIADLIIAEDVDGGTGEGGRTLVDIYNSPNDYESKGFELKLSYNYDRYFSSFSYTQIDANTVNDSTSSLSGIDESIISCIFSPCCNPIFFIFTLEGSFAYFSIVAFNKSPNLRGFIFGT